MSLKNKPKIRVSMYQYSDDFFGFLLAFRAAALQQGWTYTELQTIVFDQTENMNPLEVFNHLMQYAVIVKMPKGVRVKNGKRIPNKE